MADSKSKQWENPAPGKIADIINNARIIAVVGMSSKPERASHEVGKYLLSQGYDIIPVNPGENEILGQKTFPDLSSIGKEIDLVNIFRKAEATPPVVEEAVKIGACCIWLQEGIVSQESYAIARSAGVPIVMGRCLRKDHKHLRSAGGHD